MSILNSTCVELTKVKEKGKTVTKTVIKGQVAMEEMFSTCLPTNNTNLIDYLKSLENYVKEVVKEKNYHPVTSGALSNVRGSWLEVLMSVKFWNYFISTNQSILILKMPNVSTFNFRRLLDENAKSNLNTLEKTLLAQNVTLTTSNPDFLIIDTRKISASFTKNIISNLKETSVSDVLSLYKTLEGKCPYDSIIGGLAVKSSLRPDRRYQVVHEGNILKAIFIYLSQQNNNTDFKFKYFFATPDKLSDPDKVALSTVATHTLININNGVEKSVDILFQPNNVEDLDSAYLTILNSL